MPYKIRRLPHSNKYEVKNEKTGKIFSHGSTKDNAFKQLHLLHGVDHGMVLRNRKHL